MPRSRSIPIACTLDAETAADQAAEWAALRDHLVTTTSIEGGRRLQFPLDTADQVRDLVRREANCCAFLSLEVHETDEAVEVSITSPDPAAGPVIDLLAGV